MQPRRFGAAVRLGSLGLLLTGSLAVAGSTLAQDENQPLIDADVVADVVVEGGDARGGDAQGGDAGLNAVVGRDGDGTGLRRVRQRRGSRRSGSNAARRRRRHRW